MHEKCNYQLPPMVYEMSDKKKLINSLLPKAVLRAASPQAEEAVPPSMLIDGMIAIRSFPFRVGRESRVKIIDGRIERIERVKSRIEKPNNDLYLIDNGHLLNISREHFQIESSAGRFYLYDRGSACGTYVEERGLGGDDRDETVELMDGDLIRIGTKQSPYVFEFIVLEGFEICEKNSLTPPDG